MYPLPLRIGICLTGQLRSFELGWVRDLFKERVLSVLSETYSSSAGGSEGSTNISIRTETTLFAHTSLDEFSTFGSIEEAEKIVRSISAGMTSAGDTSASTYSSDQLQETKNSIEWGSLHLYREPKQLWAKFNDGCRIHPLWKRTAAKPLIEGRNAYYPPQGNATFARDIMLSQMFAQWGKVGACYDQILEHERERGWKFEALMRWRTDLVVSGGRMRHPAVFLLDLSVLGSRSGGASGEGEGRENLKSFFRKGLLITPWAAGGIPAFNDYAALCSRDVCESYFLAHRDYTERCGGQQADRNAREKPDTRQNAGAADFVKTFGYDFGSPPDGYIAFARNKILMLAQQNEIKYVRSPDFTPGLVLVRSLVNKVLAQKHAWMNGIPPPAPPSSATTPEQLPVTSETTASSAPLSSAESSADVDVRPGVPTGRTNGAQLVHRNPSSSIKQCYIACDRLTTRDLCVLSNELCELDSREVRRAEAVLMGNATSAGAIEVGSSMSPESESSNDRNAHAAFAKASFAAAVAAASPASWRQWLEAEPFLAEPFLKHSELSSVPPRDSNPYAQAHTNCLLLAGLHGCGTRELRGPAKKRRVALVSSAPSVGGGV